MKNKVGLSNVISVIALVLSIFIATVQAKHNEKIAYVLIEDVFNEFDFKKELEQKYTATRNIRKKILDSLEIDLSVLAGRLKLQKEVDGDQELFGRKRMEFDKKLRQFDEENVFMSKQFDEQIIKQLNQYVADYGKEMKYDIIYGNASSGSIMYGTEELNITKEVIAYINNKYKGVK